MRKILLVVSVFTAVLGGYGAPIRKGKCELELTRADCEQKGCRWDSALNPSCVARKMEVRSAPTPEPMNARPSTEPWYWVLLDRIVEAVMEGTVSYFWQYGLPLLLVYAGKVKGCLRSPFKEVGKAQAAAATSLG